MSNAASYAPDTRNDRIDIRPLGGTVGAEIHGLDLARPLEEDDVATVRSALFEHGVVFFRDQQLTPEQHIAFAARFGPINVNRFFAHAAGYPMIAEVRKEPGQKTNIGGGWHTDHSYDQEPGARLDALCARGAAAPAATPCSPACTRPMTRSPMA